MTFTVTRERVVSISPNCSLSPRQARIFMASLVIPTIVISTALALAGFWLVLPFAGLEMLAIAWALRISLRRGRYQEVVRVSDRHLVVEKGQQKVLERVEFPRYWSAVKLIPASIATYPSRLVVGCRGDSLEIGACLTESERRGLCEHLRQLVGPVEASPRLAIPR
ncbi:MAG: DUF2244 domain-containing protein [Gammaproteobacteria bacterium]|nr:DUF2244 domain-containing protein [Gammaproteobacteria bacterium]